MFKHQQGQIILIALLIMAVVLVVALAIGTLMVRELKMAANIDRSVTAYFAAESGLEEELWNVWKGPGLQETTEDLMDITEASWTTKGQPPEEEFKDEELLRDKSEQIYFDCSLDTPIKNINSVKFTDWTSAGAWLEYKVVSWPTYDLTGNLIPLDPSEIVTKEGLWDTSAAEGICIDLNEGTKSGFFYDHIFRFKPLHDDVTYTLEGYSDINCVNEIEPLPGGRLQITSTGDYRKVKRSVQITFYETPPLHGIFDYVLFSDESIVK